MDKTQEAEGQAGKEKMTNLESLIKLIETLIGDKFTGSIEVHFTQGGIGKVIMHKEIR